MTMNVGHENNFVLLINMDVNIAFAATWLITAPSGTPFDAELLYKSISVNNEQGPTRRQCDY